MLNVPRYGIYIHIQTSSILGPMMNMAISNKRAEDKIAFKIEAYEILDAHTTHVGTDAGR